MRFAKFESNTYAKFETLALHIIYYLTARYRSNTTVNNYEKNIPINPSGGGR